MFRALPKAVLFERLHVRAAGQGYPCANQDLARLRYRHAFHRCVAGLV
jgi:hypothetical protein